MDQNNEQLNIEENSTPSDDKTVVLRKRSKIWDVLLWVIIILLTIAVFVRVFVMSKVEVSGASMTAAYYASEESEHYNPALTYHDEQVVRVNKLKSPKRGDVVVFYEHSVKSKFLGNFARGKSIQKGGDYYKLIKRVVALGGDKLWVERVDDAMFKLVIQPPEGEPFYEDSYVVNKEKLDVECFIMSATCLGCLEGLTQDNPLVIKEGYFFAMGDNRANSADSRGVLGQVPLSQLFGVVV